MKKRVFVIAAIVSGALQYLAAQQTLTPANAKQVNPALARVLDRWSAQASARSPPQKKIAVKAR